MYSQLYDDNNCQFVPVGYYCNTYYQDDFENATELWIDPDPENEALQTNFTNDDDSKENRLLQLYVMFMFKWQSLFCVSDSGIEILFLLFPMFISLLGTIFLSNSISSFAKKLPTSIYKAKKQLKCNTELFLHYVTCPKCKMLTIAAYSCQIKL